VTGQVCREGWAPKSKSIRCWDWVRATKLTYVRGRETVPTLEGSSSVQDSLKTLGAIENKVSTANHDTGTWVGFALGREALGSRHAT